MSTQKKRLGDILIDCSLITEDQLKQALSFQRERGLKLGEALAELSLVTEDDIIWALGNQLNISFIHLNPDIVDSEVVRMVTSDFAREHRLMPLYKAGNQFNVCMVDPLDSRPIEYLEGKYGVSVSVSICTLFDFEQTYSVIYAPLEVRDKMAPDEIEGFEKQSFERGIPKGMEGPEKVINYILGQAIINKVNRIHCEPSEKGVIVRFRSNNVLSRKIEVPMKVHYEVISRLKKLSHINVSGESADEGILVGHFRVTVSNRQVNVQSIFFPTINGEMVILKLSDFGSILDQLGREAKASIEEVARTLHANHGVLYITGPHESGRTTTSYCILSSYEAESSKLVTVEDPVIVTLPGTTQIQIGSSGINNGLDGFRLSLMLDADIIYLDDIGDKDLLEEVAFAGIGGKSIMTSFLAHDASSSIVKLIEMASDPVVLASSFCGVLCQRLIRVLCPKCREQTEMPAVLAEIIAGSSPAPKVYKATGCDGCNQTGYGNKALISEFIPDSSTLRQMIINRQNYQDFVSFARKQGVKSLEDKALGMVLSGETSADEYLRLF